jgi:hypothetical protein
VATRKITDFTENLHCPTEVTLENRSWQFTVEEFLETDKNGRQTLLLPRSSKHRKVIKNLQRKEK